MILKNLDQIGSKEFEFTIIGSGPAGITLATTLAKKNKRILLIEAGGSNFSEKSQSFYNGKVIGDKYFPLTTCRLRYLGGTSGHWSGNCRPLDEIDFDEWIINKNSINIYENRAKEILNLKEDFHNVKSEFEEFREISFLQSEVRFGEKYNEEIKNSKNIFLLLNSPLLEIISRKDNYKKVEKIKIKLNNEKDYLLKIDKLILATGGIENSRILLWSKHLSKNDFLKNMPIGNYWSEHPGGEIAQFISEEKENNFDIRRLTKMDFAPNRNFIKREKINNMRIGFHKYDENIEKTIKHRIKDLVCIAPHLGKKVIESIVKDQLLHCFSTVNFSIEQKPIFDNKIILSDKTDIYGMPKVKLYWNIQNNVFRSLRIVLENIGEQLIKKKYGRIGIDRYVFDESFKFSKDIFAANHHIGGTIMGDNQSNSVVDKNLKVHNTENLYILGSSTFTTGGHSNPTFSIVQFSLRLADHLLL
jgi:hypothetical protein